MALEVAAAAEAAAAEPTLVLSLSLFWMVGAAKPRSSQTLARACRGELPWSSTTSSRPKSDQAEGEAAAARRASASEANCTLANPRLGRRVTANTWPYWLHSCLTCSSMSATVIASVGNGRLPTYRVVVDDASPVGADEEEVEVDVDVVAAGVVDAAAPEVVAAAVASAEDLVTGTKSSYSREMPVDLIVMPRSISSWSKSSLRVVPERSWFRMCARASRASEGR